MEQKVKRVGERGSKRYQVIFALLAIGFTFISGWNGFNFYRIMFGFSMACLIVIVFEIARIASLFRFVQKGRRVGFLSILIYFIVASMCTFAGINSFTSEIINRSWDIDENVEAQIHRIKQAYSEKIQEKMSTLNRDITYIENKLAKYHESDYLKRRLSQMKSNRDRMITERDEFLNNNPEDPERWIESKSALLGLELEKVSKGSREMRSVIQALKELWGLDKITAQKIMGILVTITVELSILLLAFLSVVKDRSNTWPARITEKKELMKILNSKFEERQVKKFLSLSSGHFNRTGKLLPMRKLSTNLRPIRILLQEYDLESLKNLFEQ